MQQEPSRVEVRIQRKGGGESTTNRFSIDLHTASKKTVRLLSNARALASKRNCKHVTPFSALSAHFELRELCVVSVALRPETQHAACTRPLKYKNVRFLS